MKCKNCWIELPWIKRMYFTSISCHVIIIGEIKVDSEEVKHCQYEIKTFVISVHHLIMRTIHVLLWFLHITQLWELYMCYCYFCISLQYKNYTCVFVISVSLQYQNYCAIVNDAYYLTIPMFRIPRETSVTYSVLRHERITWCVTFTC